MEPLLLEKNKKKNFLLQIIIAHILQSTYVKLDYLDYKIVEFDLHNQQFELSIVKIAVVHF